jgi:acyl-CoA thioester hydrolase
MSPIFVHQLDVRFRDCDPMGHVNNAVYLTYLEQARFAHWRSAWAFDPAAAASELPGVILAHAEIDFLRAAQYGDRLEVRMGVAAVGRTSFTYDYEIVDAEGHPVAKARTVQVIYDYKAGKAVAIPAKVRDALVAAAAGQIG